MILIVFLFLGTHVISSISQEESQFYQSICSRIDHEPSHVLTIPFYFPSYSLTNKDAREILTMESFGHLHNPGEPLLPMRIFSIALPPNAIPIGLTYDIIQTETVDHPVCLVPYVSPQPYGKAEEIKSVSYDDETFFPEQTVTVKQRSYYHSLNLVDIAICPFTYHPKSQTLSFHSSLEVTIEYQFSSALNEKRSMISEHLTHFADNVVYNYEQVTTWYVVDDSMNQGLYDFVIITLESLTDAIQELVSWEGEKGRTVSVVTLTWIEEHYDGYDVPEKIRNFLREKYPTTEWGIKDLLIVGHWDDIPMRKTVQKMGFDDEECAETDFYYAELSLPDTESWDTDGDHRYGESRDSIDFFGEIAVGRIPWSEPDIVEHICHKSVSYEQNTDPAFRNNILLLANFVDDNTDGAVFMEYCVDADLHPWMESWMKTRLYERESSYMYDYVLNHRNVVDVWSQGTYGIVSWHSHGGPYGSGGFISVDDCQYLNDEYPAIISAASCSNSDTNYLNIGQAMMRQGAVGFLGANKATPYRTRWDEASDGSDQSFKYFFLSALTSGEYSQGEAHQYALYEMYQRGLWGSEKYETFVHGSLFGNPDISVSSSFENNPPTKPDTPQGPSSGTSKRQLSYITQTSDPEHDDVYYCFSWNDGTIEWVGPYQTGEEIEVSHSWDEQGSYAIKVKAKDVTGAESDWSEPLLIQISKEKTILSFMFEKFYELLSLISFFK